jgi:predicted RNA-binding Zn-ribbon protein involved in translation (DUF1610 family)
MKVRLYCPVCGWERIITGVLDAIAITDSSYKLARQRKELTCPECGHGLAASPCILYPGGWAVLDELVKKGDP